MSTLPEKIKTRICVCILTYKRPHTLKVALQSVLAQSALSDPAIVMSILVVDNDALASASDIVCDTMCLSPISYRYVVEREQGVVKGRNRVLNEAGECDFLALLDDDEVAIPDWLEMLLWAQREYNADVVTGPVDPVFEDEPAWVQEGRFFSPRALATGSRPKTVETNNVLLSCALAKRYRFDPRFDATGGEDTFFFAEVGRDGATIVWCEEARVKEEKSPTRTTPEWLIDRERSDANRFTRVCLYLEPGLATVWERIYRAFGSLMIGIFLFLRRGNTMQGNVQARQRIARFGGTLSALRGRDLIYYTKGSKLP